ncbi:hypothetical protein ABT336_09010 [Micromonospora sp. NPDC000207]|uniref:hypothetical protein n=1 Tax=Micromonospora sp. NPDC000207 TaxID=3154246 RepID=UPI003330B515
MTDLKRFLTPENLAAFEEMPKRVQKRVAEKEMTVQVVQGMRSHQASLNPPKKKAGSLHRAIVHSRPEAQAQYDERYGQLNQYVTQYCAKRADQDAAAAAATGDVSQYAGMSSAQGGPGPVGSSARPAHATGPMQWQSSSPGR